MNPVGFTIKEIQDGKMEAFKWFFERSRRWSGNIPARYGEIHKI